MSDVLERARETLGNCEHLAINHRRIREVADLVPPRLTVPRWETPGIHLPTQDPDEVTCYFLVLNSLNFCFFNPSRTSAVRYSDGVHSGATLLAKRLTNSWERLGSPEILRNIAEEDVSQLLFQPPGAVPLLQERAQALREVGVLLMQMRERHDSAKDLFKEVGGDAYQTAALLPELLPNWADPYLKRAQLFVGMVYGRLQNSPRNPIDEETLIDLTVFADYRLPQALIAMGVLLPSADLSQALSRKTLIAEDSQTELEIRAATVVAGDALMTRMREAPSRANQRVTALEVDWFLWSSLRDRDKARRDGLFIEEVPPHHRTITTRY